MDEKDIQALKAKYGPRLYELTASGRSIIVRPPTGLEYQRFEEQLADPAPAIKVSAAKNLLLTCTVSPDGKGMTALLEELPGIYEPFAKELTEIAGFARKAEKKAL